MASTLGIGISKDKLDVATRGGSRKDSYAQAPEGLRILAEEVAALKPHRVVLVACMRKLLLHPNAEMRQHLQWREGLALAAGLSRPDAPASGRPGAASRPAPRTRAGRRSS